MVALAILHKNVKTSFRRVARKNDLGRAHLESLKAAIFCSFLRESKGKNNGHDSSKYIAVVMMFQDYIFSIATRSFE